MSDARTYCCPTCVGTGSMESSDSGDESWWDCRRCEGTGKLADRRHPSTAERRALDAEAEYRDFLENLTRALNDAGVPAMPSWPDAIAYLVRQRDEARSEAVALRAERDTLRAAGDKLWKEAAMVVGKHYGRGAHEAHGAEFRGLLDAAKAWGPLSVVRAETKGER